MHWIGLLILGIVFASHPISAIAASSGWMNEGQLKFFVQSKLSKGKGFYPTTIDCKPGQYKFGYEKVPDPKPFHKWNYVHGNASALSSLVTQLKLSDRPDLKYRIVSKAEYVDTKGIKMGCALAYR